MLPTLGEERRATYSPFLPISPRHRPCAAGADAGARRRGGHHHLRRPGRRADRGAGHRRPCEAAVEARLGHALDGAGRRLRDVGQGPDRERAASAKVCRALGGVPPEGFNYELFLDDRRQEDLQVQGQRPDHGGVAALRHAREPELVHVPVAEVGQDAAFQRHSAAIDDYLQQLDAFNRKRDEGANAPT